MADAMKLVVQCENRHRLVAVDNAVLDIWQCPVCQAKGVKVFPFVGGMELSASRVFPATAAGEQDEPTLAVTVQIYGLKDSQHPQSRLTQLRQALRAIAHEIEIQLTPLS